ncbi:MAG: CofH family radical SAM protein [Prevotellaceae bacterium]|jgi:cyclic dehypoxanthinyl futalosine synthase|nr:CofH family radical SAM protein [Prevotellaceae bacterium]
MLSDLYKKSLDLVPLSDDEALRLYEQAPLATLMHVACELRQRHVPGNGVSWQIDRNVNITNVCISGCKFCTFHCGLHSPRAYTTTPDEYAEKIEALFAKGGNQLLLQGGLHPKYGLEFYEALFRTLKRKFPLLKLHALGPPEVAHIAQLEKLSYRQTLERLVAAGLDSLPGAGAEILDDRVRKLLSPAKPDAQAWLDVMREAHQMGLATSATMMFGHIETHAERIKHLRLIRDLQREKPHGAPGFLAFICWPAQLDRASSPIFKGTKKVLAEEYIRTVAISRIMLYNVPNIQASWLTVGKAAAQLCLCAGANDFGSIMLEENVVSSAGESHAFDKEGITAAIREAGYEPWLRNQRYMPVKLEQSLFITHNS